MVKIGIIIGSTRPGRKAVVVAKWAYEIARKRKDAEFELVDIADFNLPLLDEPMPPVFGQYSHDHTRAWSAKIASFDGYVFVTPEYSHATSYALKNAIEFLHNEWINKAAGFIGYGGMSGARAVENLRLIMGQVQVATVRALRPRNGGPRIASVWKRGRNGFERSRQNNTGSRILHKS